MRKTLIQLAASAALAGILGLAAAQDKLVPEPAAPRSPVDRLKLPKGFKAEVWASGLPGARALVLADSGNKVYVGTRMVGRVYEVTDLGGRRAVRIVAEELALPAALRFEDGDLYVFAADKVLRFDDIETHPNARPVEKPENQPRAAPLRGYTGDMFPAEYRNSIFVARPGARDGDKLLGYDVVSIRAGEDCNHPVATPFLTGFVDARVNKFWGVPAQVVQAPDGSLLVADEQLGVIYRISYAARQAPVKK